MTDKILIDGVVGKIEIAIDRPSGAVHGLALVAHPHPLFGGTMDNKVAQTLARTLTELGYISVRPNFRGVGATAGEHDHGDGETQDLLQVVAWMRQHLSNDAPLVLAGFSFGSFVQTRVVAALSEPVQRMVLVGTAAGKWDVLPVPADSIVIHGEQDDVIELSAVLDWARPQKLPVTVIPGAGHFFHGDLHLLKQIIRKQW
ncbi:MAG: alpha/beta hydrolase [Formosimonas sp.]